MVRSISLYDPLSPDILLLDIRMDGMSGLEAGTQTLNRHPGAKILFLTIFSDDEYIVRSLHIGAKGYILKQNFESILPALAAVENGQTVFGDEITARLPSHEAYAVHIISGIQPVPHYRKGNDDHTKSGRRIKQPGNISA